VGACLDLALGFGRMPFFEQNSARRVARLPRGCGCAKEEDTQGEGEGVQSARGLPSVVAKKD